MPLMLSHPLTAPSWRCAAPESVMSWVSVSFVALRVAISASIRLKSGHVRPVTTATPLRPLDQRGSFEADGSPCASALLMRTTLLSCRAKSSPNLQKKRATGGARFQGRHVAEVAKKLFG